MKMEFIEEKDLYKFKSELLKCRVAFKKNDDTIYIAAFEKKNTIGFVGYKILKDSVRLKTDYVSPEHRGKGLYDKMFKHRMDVIKEKFGDVPMTAYCTPMSRATYLRYGFKIVSTSAKGIAFVRYETL